MGMFRRVHLDLPCERCGDAHRAEVQFKTDSDYQESYDVGERVEELPLGEEWDGITNRFCPSCFDAYRAERLRSATRIAADLVRSGQLALMEGESPLTADEILARGEKIGADPSSYYYGEQAVLGGLRALLRRDDAWLTESEWHEAYGSWQNVTLYPLLRTELRRRGWPCEDGPYREDLIVELDADRRILVYQLGAG